MDTEKQALLDAHNRAENDMQIAESAKNSAVSQLEEFKKKNSSKLENKSLTAVETATLNSLKDDVSFARRAFNLAKSTFEMAKYKAKKAGAIVVERAISKVTDSPEVKAIKEKIAVLRNSISALGESKKEMKATHKVAVANHKKQLAEVNTQIAQHRESVAGLKEEIYKLDPSQRPKVTDSDEPAKKPGRKSKLAGCVISLHPDYAEGDNPHKKGSSAHATFNAFREAANQSISYEGAVATGIPAKDISLLIKSGKLVANKND